MLKKKNQSIHSAHFGFCGFGSMLLVIAVIISCSTYLLYLSASNSRVLKRLKIATAAFFPLIEFIDLKI